jgi:hypothetical protein
MIKYELAKKLYKDGTFKSPVPVTEANEKYLEYPPLSELIDACGDKLIALQRHDESFDIGFQGWEAVSEWEVYYPPEIVIGAYGKTPEEAVSRLWLLINK